MKKRVVLKGKKVVVIGATPGHLHETLMIRRKLKEIGAIRRTKVTKDVDLVIKGTNAGTVPQTLIRRKMLAKAKEYGIRIIPFKQVAHRLLPKRSKGK